MTKKSLIMSQLMWIPVNSPKTIHSNNGMGDSQREWQSSHKHVESAAAPTTSKWSIMVNREETFPVKAAQLSSACKSLSLVWRTTSHSSNDEAAMVSSTGRSSTKTQSSNFLNSLPSGMTIGISGAAPSAERDPDSLVREDDSLFPACLLELFLSHISSAKSPLFFFLCLSSLQSLTHDLFAPSESTAARSEAPVIRNNQTRVPTDWVSGVFPATVDLPGTKFRPKPSHLQNTI